MDGLNYFNYFTEIEEFFVARRRKHILLSPLDWNLIETWKEMGVPLHVAVRGIDWAMSAFEARKQRHRLVNNLFFCNQAVLEEFERFLSAGAGRAIGGGCPDDSDGGMREGGPPNPPSEGGQAHADAASRRLETVRRIVDGVSREISELPGGVSSACDGVRLAVTRVLPVIDALRDDLSRDVPPDLERVDQDLRRIDDILVPALQSSLGQEKLESLCKECRDELRTHRKSLPKPMYEKLLHNLTRRKVKECFGLSCITTLYIE